MGKLFVNLSVTSYVTRHAKTRFMSEVLKLSLLVVIEVLCRIFLMQQKCTDISIIDEDIDERTLETQSLKQNMTKLEKEFELRGLS